MSVLYLQISIAALVLGYASHPALLSATVKVWHLNAGPGEASNFETSFFGLVSIVYGLFAGQVSVLIGPRH